MATILRSLIPQKIRAPHRTFWLFRTADRFEI
jgi:hypothetical protein